MDKKFKTKEKYIQYMLKFYNNQNKYNRTLGNTYNEYFEITDSMGKIICKFPKHLI